MIDDRRGVPNGPMFLRLFHGRTFPNEVLDDWGLDGPYLGNIEYLHTTYRTHIRFGWSTSNHSKLDGEIFDIEDYLVEDMFFYDGIYYGDWSFTPNVPLDVDIQWFDKSKLLRL